MSESERIFKYSELHKYILSSLITTLKRELKMTNLINKIYEQNKHNKITKKEIKDMINFLKNECKYTLDELETYYSNSGVAGLLFMTELEKFSRNAKNI